MLIETIIKIYNATLENRKIKAEDLIMESAKAADFTDEGIRRLIAQYNKTIREATERAEAEGKDVIDCLKEVENKIEIEEKLPSNLSSGQKKQEIDFPNSQVNTGEAKEPPKDNIAFEDEDKYDLSVDDGTKDNINFPDAKVNTGEAKEPPKDNIAFEDEDKYDLSVDDGTEDNINFPDAKVNTGEAKEPPKDNIAFEDEDKYDLSVDDGTEDNINFPDAKVNTGEAKEPPKDNIDFKDKPINDTKTGNFQFGDESTDGAKYLTNNKEFDSLDIDDGNDNTPPDEGNDNTPPSGPALK